ncbi:MAG: hypothetical protein ABIK09_21100 [Pseudomonadota bacterium]
MTFSREWVARVSGVFLIFAGSAAAAAAPKGECDSEDCIVTDVYEAGAEVPLGGELLLLGVGDTVEMCRDHACWASYDSCADAYRLPLGVGTGTYGESRTRSLDANFDSGYCGWGAYAGAIAGDDDLVLFWPGATVFDSSTSDGGQAKFQIWIYQDSGASCTGSRTYKGGDTTATCTTEVNRRSWQEAIGDGRSDCEGVMTDPVGCHLPDLLLLHPGSATDAWYYYILRVSLCDTDGTNCVGSDETGCFQVHWD